MNALELPLMGIGYNIKFSYKQSKNLEAQKVIKN